MADYTVSSVLDLIAHQRITHPNSVYGSAFPSTPTGDMIGVNIHMYHGFIEVAANTNPGSFYVQTRLEASDDQWITVAQFTVTDATPVTEALTATEGVGETVLAVADTTGFAANDFIYITDMTADTDDEWHQLDKIVTNTSLDLTEGLVAEKASGDDAYTEAQQFAMYLSLAGVWQYRVIYKAEGATGANVAIWARGVEVTDFA